MFYRLRTALKYWSFKRQTRRLYASPPTPCDPAAPCTVHTMLSATDTPLYLVAIKSLLRFGGPFAVTVHDDGTLDERCRALLSQHVPGCKVVSAAEANERAERVLGGNSFLTRWRNADCNYRRLVDTDLWSTTPRRIIMDSDVLVLRPLGEVSEWALHGETPFLIGQPPPPGAAGTPGLVQTIFKGKLSEISASLGLPATFLDGTTGALWGCTTQLTLDRVERLMRCTEELGIPMRQWGGDQCAIIYLLSAAGAVRLDPDTYFNFFPHCIEKVPEAKFVHFFGTYRFHKNLYPRLAAEIADGLAALSPPALSA